MSYSVTLRVISSVLSSFQERESQGSNLDLELFNRSTLSDEISAELLRQIFPNCWKKVRLGEKTIALLAYHTHLTNIEEILPDSDATS